MWACKCDCGSQRSVIGADLRSGRSASCGCTIDDQRLGNLKRTHGSSGTRLHYAWKNMRSRCSNPDNGSFRYYGGRGISICKEWDDFSTFRDWAMENGYSSELTLERIDVNGDYCPRNCTWATKDAQAVNKTNNLRSPDGELWLHKARKHGVKDSAFRRRIFAGWPPEEAASVGMNVRRIPRTRTPSGRYK